MIAFLCIPAYISVHLTSKMRLLIELMRVATLGLVAGSKPSERPVERNQ